MKLWMIFTLALAFSVSALAQANAHNVLEETYYQNFKSKLLNQNKNKKVPMGLLSRFEQSLFVDAIWDLADEGNSEIIDSIDDVQLFNYELMERLRVAILRIKYKRAATLPESLKEELLVTLQAPEVEIKLIYTLAAYEEDLLAAGHMDVIELAKKHPGYFDISEDETRRREITDDIVADLFHKTPDITTYMNGEYVKSVKVFKFCRENRLYPCLMVMKDVHGQVVRNADGSIWNQPSLASSARGLPSYTRNGNTPAGIFTIDSVMPVADQQLSFGKFRRMILNFVPKSKDEVLFKSLLPESSRNSDWWKTSVAARDIGRNLFRIHGTGKINNDPTTPYYPFMRTSGCVSQRENSYAGVTYRDQRDLLDTIMKAMNLAPTYENEIKIKGILYFIEIDDQNAPVTVDDLAYRGIE